MAKLTNACLKRTESDLLTASSVILSKYSCKGDRKGKVK